MAGKKKASSSGPKMLSNAGRGDFVILKRHLNKKGEISKKARLGTVRKAGPDGHEIMWHNKSDRKQSMSRRKHNPETLHVIDGKTARKVSQYLHKHIATTNKPKEEPSVDPKVNPKVDPKVDTPAETPPVETPPVETPPVETPPVTPPTE